MKAFGSSTGSAISSALGLAFASLGTETVSSIVSPAERSNVFGLNPTKDLIANDGIICGSLRQDVAGPLTRSVKDAASILSVIATPSDDEHVSQSRKPTDYTEFCKGVDLNGIRIGIPRNLANGLTKAQDDAFQHAQTVLRSAGASIVDPADISGVCEYEQQSPAERQIVLETDNRISIESYISTLHSNPKALKSLRDIMDFTRSFGPEDYPHRNVELMERANVTDTRDPFYQRMLAREKYFVNEVGIEDTLRTYDLDLLLLPAASRTVGEFAARAGTPVLNVPMGYYPPGTEVRYDDTGEMVATAPGIPFSMYMFGKRYGEGGLLKTAFAFEQKVMVRRHGRPYQLPLTDLSDVVERRERMHKV